MLSVYRVEPDPDYQSLVPVDAEGLAERLNSIWRFDGSEINAHDWGTPQVRVANAEKAVPDIWSAIRGNNFAFSHRATRVLQTFLDQSGEQLPLQVGGKHLVFLNVSYVVNCLNKKLSIADADCPGEFKQYVFRPQRLEYPLFKIPETCAWELLVVEGTDDSNHDFKPLVEKHGLKGLRFIKLWDEE